MAEPLGALQLLGLTEVEARLYLALLPRGPLTGYELARVAGVGRPNVYPALERLERRGAVMRVPADGGVKYAAVPYKRFLRRLEEEHRDSVEEARRSLAAVHSPPKADEGPFVAVGYENLVAAAKRLCGEATHHLLVANCAAEAAVLDPALQAAAARGVAVGTLCLQACPTPCGHCMGSLVRADFLSSGSIARWLLCLRDDDELLVGEIPAAGDARVTLTHQRPFLAAGVGLLCYAATLAERGRTAEPLPDSARFQAWLDTR